MSSHAEPICRTGPHLKPPLNIWTVYDHPLDFPGHYVARRWEVTAAGGDPVATAEVCTHDDLETLRSYMRARGLYRLERDKSDDPKIIEVWL